MSWKQGNPGCPCCSCVADASHVCICSCLTPYSKTATIGDDLGTWTMTWNGVSWNTATLTLHNVQTYATSAGQLGVCSALPNEEPFNRVEYSYNLSQVCATQKWVLTLTFTLCSCSDTLNSPRTSHYGYPDASSGVLRVPFSAPAIDMDCSNTDMLTFNLPTATPDGLAFPGGGGTMTVVFS